MANVVPVGVMFHGDHLRSAPPGATAHTEQLIRLPGIQWSYRPPASPEGTDLPALQKGGVTFGSMNNLAKVSAAIIGVWSRIVHAQPDARLLLMTGAGCEGDQRVSAEFAHRGIDNQRLTLLNKRPHEQYLRLYHDVDICLDPFPFTGCTTTCDALWMGVPVITLAGRTCVSRQGVGLLSHIGLPELIAATPDAYVEMALRLATDPDKLQELRRGLRKRMQASLLTDPQGFTRNLEAAYWRMWQTL